jgi:hypothetical protein
MYFGAFMLRYFLEVSGAGGFWCWRLLVLEASGAGGFWWRGDVLTKGYVKTSGITAEKYRLFD